MPPASVTATYSAFWPRGVTQRACPEHRESRLGEVSPNAGTSRGPSGISRGAGVQEKPGDALGRGQRERPSGEAIVVGDVPNGERGTNQPAIAWSEFHLCENRSVEHARESG